MAFIRKKSESWQTRRAGKARDADGGVSLLALLHAHPRPHLPLPIPRSPPPPRPPPPLRLGLSPCTTPRPPLPSPPLHPIQCLRAHGTCVCRALGVYRAVCLCARLAARGMHPRPRQPDQLPYLVHTPTTLSNPPPGPPGRRAAAPLTHRHSHELPAQPARGPGRPAAAASSQTSHRAAAERGSQGERKREEERKVR